MTMYLWKLESLAKGVDPDLAQKELERISKKYGSLSPEYVVEESRPSDAILHPIFEWDDNKAAEHYRVQQARMILNNIRIEIISDGESEIIPVYEVISTESERTYKRVDTFTQSDISYVKEQTEKALKQLAIKLKRYKAFYKVQILLQEALRELENIDAEVFEKQSI